MDDRLMATIRGGASEFNLIASDPQEFPELPSVDEAESFQLPSSLLREMISGTLFAVSENQGRPIHTGVKFEVEEDRVSAIAVDGFRLARRTYHPEEGTGRELSFVVPAAGLKEGEKIVADVESCTPRTEWAKENEGTMYEMK